MVQRQKKEKYDSLWGDEEEKAYLMVSDQVWYKDSWSLAEFLDVVESRDDWKYMNGYSGFALQPMTCLYQIILDLEDSPFLDMEQGKANFDHEDFFRVIEVVTNIQNRVQLYLDENRK